MITEVFTPGSIPTVTYFERDQRKLETSLLEAVDTPGLICSLVGPSKSGKTVLCEKVVGKKMIKVSGGGITSEAIFWQRLRSKLNLPVSESKKDSSSRVLGTQIDAKGKAGILFFAEGEAGAQGKIESEKSNERSLTYDGPDGPAILDYLRNKKIPLVVDDFHYIEPGTRRVLVQQFKEAAYLGNSIILISVSHRADDAIRVNPDLRGRLYCIDIPPWTPDELREIALKGFDNCLNIQMEEPLIKRLISESCQSPQLMQALCLQLCRNNGIEKSQDPRLELRLNQQQIEAVFRDTVRLANCQSTLQIILSDRRAATKRKLYSFENGQSGDLYKLILKAISRGEPVLDLPYSLIRTRMDKLVDNVPSANYIQTILDRIYMIQLQQLENDVVMEWDLNSLMLYITDPYFLYYIRWAEW